MGSKKAIIIGIAGQDGSYLAELLLSHGYKVFGILKRLTLHGKYRLNNIINQIDLIYLDILNLSELQSVLSSINPDEIYNLSGNSFVMDSWIEPQEYINITAMGIHNILDSILKTCPQAKFYQASSSEMFGNVDFSPQDENTPFFPRNPYGTSKLFAHWLTKNFREKYDLFTVSGILFNHESHRRGIQFVTRKITYSVAKIVLGIEDKLYIGNVDARRDWGFAKEYVEAIWLMVQQDTPQDLVIGTGKNSSVLDLIKIAFDSVGLDYKEFIVFDDNLARTEKSFLISNPKKAEKILNWKAKKSIEELIIEMVNSDIDFIKFNPNHKEILIDSIR